jgi:predicted DNA-binding ribbon-helix-helix protein
MFRTIEEGWRPRIWLNWWCKLLTKLSEDVLELHGNVHNFASLLRCSCLIYLQTRPRSSMPAGSLPLGKVAPAA